MNNQFQDIMPIEEISIDYSIYFMYIGIFIIGLILIFLIKKFLFKKKQIALTSKEIAIRELKLLDLNCDNGKEVLYRFTLLSKGCVEDKERLDFVLKQIEPLKYKKENFKLENKTKQLLKGYINDI